MRNNLRGDGNLLCNVAVSRIIFDFLDEQLTMITRLPNHGDIIQVSSSPSPLFFFSLLSLLPSPLSPSLSSTSPLSSSFCPLCHVNRDEKFMSRATTFPRRLLSGSHFVYVRIVDGTMARAATIMRPPPIRSSLRLCIFHGGLCCSSRYQPPLKLSTVSSFPMFVDVFFFRFFLQVFFVSPVC